MARLFFAAVITAIAFPAFAGSIMINDAYARVTPHAKTGAVFLEVMNMADTDDRLISVSTEIAARAELHTHLESDEGVMMMRHVEDGFAVPAGTSYLLKRGGDHVMLMGLDADLADGDTIDLILTFEEAGDVPLRVQIDNARKPNSTGMKHDH